MTARFNELLKDLSDEHNQEIARLKAQIEEFNGHKTTVQEKNGFDMALSVDSADSDEPGSPHQPSAVKSKSKVSSSRLGESSSQQPGIAVSNTSRLQSGAAHGPDVRGLLAKKLDHVRNEVRKLSGSEEDRDSEEAFSFRDRCMYRIENLTTLYPHFFFYILCFVTIFLVAVLGVGWRMTMEEYELAAVPWTYHIVDAFQLIVSAGIDTSIRSGGKTIVFVCGMAVGLLVFAVLVVLITDGFQSLLLGINEGKSKVPETGHTLLLGWNESTERVVVQLALLRRQFIKQNSGFLKKMCPWLRTPASTPVAQASIVVMCNDRTKAEMHERIERAFTQRGISQKERVSVGMSSVGWGTQWIHKICKRSGPKMRLQLQL
jgi:hypothetical protein